MKFYSFHYGTETMKRENWILFDLKIPAVNIKAAVTHFYFYETMRRSYKNRKLEKIKFELPDISYIKTFIRLVDEYDRKFTPKRGRTVHYFKKEKVYRPNEIIRYFPSKIHV